CHAAGVCDPVTAVCSNPPLADGATCSDGNGCTIGDVCVSGACTSGALEQCNGTCDPSNGVCTPWPPISVAAVSVGKGLEAPAVVTLSVPAPAGGVQLTITSGDPSKLLVATSPIDAGSASVVVTVAEGATTSATPIYVQALVDIGTADLIAS